VVYEKEEDIAFVMTNFFINLFQTFSPQNILQVVSIVQGRVNIDMKTILNQPFSHEDVWLALKQMKPMATPGLELAIFILSKVLAHYWR